MNTTFKTTTILTSASIAAVLFIAAAFHTPVPASMNNIASVTVSAKRMTLAQKQSFDLESQGVQTVVISTKRLSPAQKIAMAQEDRAVQIALAQKRMRTTG